MGEGRKKRERHDKTPLSQEVLVTKNDLQEIKQKHFELNEHKEEAIVQSDFMKRLNEIKTQEKLKEKADDFARDNQIWEAACEEVRLEIEDSHTFYDGEQKKESEEYRQNLEELAEEHRQLLMVEIEKYYELKNKVEILECHQEEKNLDSEEKHGDFLDALSEELNKSLCKAKKFKDKNLTKLNKLK